jgi:large-conductance mechanosensitive channel
MVQGTYNLFFCRWPALPIDRLVGDETATFANTEIQCHIDITKCSYLVGLLQQCFFPPTQPLASCLDFGGYLSTLTLTFRTLTFRTFRTLTFSTLTFRTLTFLTLTLTFRTLTFRTLTFRTLTFLIITFLIIAFLITFLLQRLLKHLGAQFSKLENKLT